MGLFVLYISVMLSLLLAMPAVGFHGAATVRWCYVDGHYVDGHYVDCHQCHVVLNDSYVDCL